jgi:prepilin-type processing-associated H-X9-DG protein
VAIVIIALLAAILFPVFGRARENARRSACQSNLKQLCFAAIQYTADYDEQWMPLRDTPLTSIPSASIDDPVTRWSATLSPYVRTGQIYCCPSKYTGQTSAFTYTHNMRLTGSNPGEVGGTGRKLAAIPLPAVTPAFCDGIGYQATGVPGQSRGLQFAINQTASYSQVFSWAYETSVTQYTFMSAGLPSGSAHFDGLNIAYVDGHVKWSPFFITHSAWKLISTNDAQTRQIPPAGLDFDADGTVGTSTKYD